jgi:hypothetical protein
MNLEDPPKTGSLLVASSSSILEMSVCYHDSLFGDHVLVNTTLSCSPLEYSIPLAAILPYDRVYYVLVKFSFLCLNSFLEIQNLILNLLPSVTLCLPSCFLSLLVFVRQMNDACLSLLLAAHAIIKAVQQTHVL